MHTNTHVELQQPSIYGESHVSVDVVKVMLMSLLHKNKPQDPFKLLGDYLTTLVKLIRSHSL